MARAIMPIAASGATMDAAHAQMSGRSFAQPPAITAAEPQVVFVLLSDDFERHERPETRTG